MNLESHYRELDLEPTATREEIKRAYKDLVKVWHPDRFANNPSLRAKAEQKLKRINIAYQFLLEHSTAPSASSERRRSHKDRPHRQSATNSRSSTQRGKGADSESPSQQTPEASTARPVAAGDVRGNESKKLVAGGGIALLAVFLVVLILWRNPFQENGTPARLPASDPAADGVGQILRRATAHMDAGDYDSAIADYTEAIRLDPEDARAYRLRGDAYQQKGQQAAAERDFEQAQRKAPIPSGFFWSNPWLEKPFQTILSAANSGDVDAILAMATIYGTGTEFFGISGVDPFPPDPVQAAQWYEKGAKHNDWRAQYNLAVLYYDGHGVEADHTKAKALFELAAESGDTMAQAGLGIYYMNIEVGGRPHPWYKEGAKWHLLAAEGGDRYSQYAVATLYEAGLGVVRDPSEALKWFLISASNGLEPALTEVSRLERTLTPEAVESARASANAFVPRPASAVGSHMVTRTILLIVLGVFSFVFTFNLFLRGRYTESVGGILGFVILGVIGSGFYFASWQFGLLMLGLSLVFIAISKPIAGALARRTLGSRT